VFTIANLAVLFKRFGANGRALLLAPDAIIHRKE